VAIFPNAYHIKVAVRDQEAFWLSSGNWNNSNQPGPGQFSPDDPDAAQEAATFDRDWHVVVEHAALAQSFAAYIENDRTVRRCPPQPRRRRHHRAHRHRSILPADIHARLDEPRHSANHRLVRRPVPPDLYRLTES
jgi:hypothetical protein